MKFVGRSRPVSCRGVQGSWTSKAENTLPAPKPIVKASGGMLVSTCIVVYIRVAGGTWKIRQFIRITLRAQL